MKEAQNFLLNYYSKENLHHNLKIIYFTEYTANILQLMVLSSEKQITLSTSFHLLVNTDSYLS